MLVAELGVKQGSTNKGAIVSGLVPAHMQMVNVDVTQGTHHLHLVLDWRQRWVQVGGEGEVRGIAKKKKKTGLISFVWFLGSANIHLDLDMVYEQKESRWREKPKKKIQQGKKKNQQNLSERNLQTERKDSSSSVVKQLR